MRCLLWIIFLSAQSAQAVTIAEIAGRDVPLRREPYDDAPVMLLLRNGQYVKVKEESQKQGYWRVESYRGNEGWVAIEYLRFGEYDEKDFHRQNKKIENRGDAQAVAMLKEINKHGYDIDEDRRRPKLRDPRFHRYRTQLALGRGFSRFKEVIALTGIGEAKDESLFGVQFGVRPTLISPWSFGLYYEQLTSADVGTANNGDNYTVTSSAKTLYFEILYDLSIKQDWFFAVLSLSGGRMLNGKLSFIQSGETSATTYAGKGWGGMAKLDLHWKFSYIFSILMGGGYRILKSTAALPTATGTGSDVIESGGDEEALPVRFNGPFFHVGLSINFN